MKRNRVFAALALLVAAAACQKEFSFVDEPLVEEQPPVFTIEASVDVNETRAFLDETGDIFWNSGDALAVFQGSKAEPYRFATEEQGLSCRFTYNGELDAADGDFFALYPYNEAARCADGVISTVIPTEQTAAAGTFGKDANLAVAFAPFRQPMSFRNAAAYVKVSFKTADENAAITRITVRSIDESVLLSGSVTLTPTVATGADGVPAVSDVALAVTEGVPYASVVAPSGTTLAKETDYYIVVAPAALTSGYRIEFTTSAGLTFSKDYSGASYNSASFKRNTIAPVGKKNLDNYEMEGFWRVRNRNLASANHPGTGEYLVVYKMQDGSYRILNENRSDTYIVKGTHFELSGSKMVANESYKRQQMEGMVAYVFRNAYYSSSAAQDGVVHADDALILVPEDYGIEVASYKKKTGYSSKTIYFANVTLYNRTDNTQIVLTLDDLSCSLQSTDEGTISGYFNKQSGSTNPAGNSNTCSDLVNALLKHASFSGLDSMVKGAAVDAIEGTDNAFTGGFTTATHTTKNNVVCKDHFMIKTAELLSGAQISNIRLYKWGSGTYSEYVNN